MKMKPNRSHGLLLTGMLVLAGLPAAAKDGPQDRTKADPGFEKFNLVSDITNNADHLDASLVNPWGIAASPTGPIWINANGTGVMTIYDATGATLRAPVKIPAPDGTAPAAPTGLVFNSTARFVLTSGDTSAPASFIAATEDGTIVAWSGKVTGAAPMTVVDNSAGGAIYKGLALALAGKDQPQLYAANFHSGQVDVFDGSFKPLTSFTDPGVPAGYAPFNVQAVRGRLVVTFARQQTPDLKDDEPGPGNGFVDLFKPDGTLVRRLVSGGALNSPWGVALAPARFGKFAHALLVGNFGDGKINAFDWRSGRLLGHLTLPNGNDVTIDGLWAIAFLTPPAAMTPVPATGAPSGMDADDDKDGDNDHDDGPDIAAPAPQLFFTAGSDFEAHGLFGFLRPVRLFRSADQDD